MFKVVIVMFAFILRDDFLFPVTNRSLGEGGARWHWEVYHLRGFACFHSGLKLLCSKVRGCKGAGGQCGAFLGGRFTQED